jgi:hypothetical protein
MVRSRLPFPKHPVLAVVILGLSVCGVEFGLHLHDACLTDTGSYSDRNACAPSWTVHHLLKPDVRISATDPDTGSEVSWRTNSWGLRGGEIEIPKPVGRYRVVCLGDDSTLAPETPSAETFCARLRGILAQASPMEVEVINAGCPQYGPLLSLLLLKHSLLGLAPDLVVCNFDMSDVADDHRCRRSVRMNGSQPLYCPHPELERERNAAERMWVERLLMWQHAKHGLAYLLGGEDRPEDNRDIDAPQGTYAWLRDDPPDWSVYVNQTLDMIGAINQVCRRSNCQFVLAAIPAPWQVSASAAGGPGVRTRVGVEEHAVYKSRVPFETLATYAKKQGILFCDPSKIFVRVKEPDRLYRRNAARFSARGHDLYARVLGRFVQLSVPGPWGSGPPQAPRSEPQISAREESETGSELKREGPFSALDEGPTSEEHNARAVRPAGFNRKPNSVSAEGDAGTRSAERERNGLTEESPGAFDNQGMRQPVESGRLGRGPGESRRDGAVPDEAVQDETGQGDRR